MTAFIPDRFRPILGPDGRTIVASGVEALLTVPEGDELEFKKEPCGNGESEKRDLAADVASLANHRGGLLIIGIDEGDDTEPPALTPLPTASLDAEELRIRSITASSCAPLPPFEIVRVGVDGGAVLVLCIPPSPGQPHAVTMNESLRYPVRYGSKKRYMSESEVAQRYRSRFDDAATHVGFLRSRHEALRQRIGVTDAAWVVAAIQPDRPGRAEHTADAAQRLRDWVSYEATTLPGFHDRVHVNLRGGYRSYRYQDHEPDAYARLGTLYTDGASSAGFAWQGRLLRDGEPLRPISISDEDLVASVINVLYLGAAWAVREAGTAGTATVRVQLDVPAPGVVAAQYRTDFPDQLRGSTPLGMGGGTASETTVDLGALASSGRDLVLAARMIVQDLLADFGLFEPRQVTEDGVIDLRWWYRERHATLRAWGQEHGVVVDPPAS